MKNARPYFELEQVKKGVFGLAENCMELLSGRIQKFRFITKK